MAVAGLLFVAVGCGGNAGASVSQSTAAVRVTTTAGTLALTPDSAGQRRLDDARMLAGAPGAVAVLRNGGGEWTGVSGEADLDGTELKDTTRFRVGGITESVLAVLVLDAVARGQLSLDALVSDLLPGTVLPAPPMSPDQPMTVRMLLDHTSGLFNAGAESDLTLDVTKLTDPAVQREAAVLAADYLSGEPVSLPAHVYVALAMTHPRYFPPGTGFHFSDANSQLAGMVLERVTGTPLPDLLRERIVQPLGLLHTTMTPYDQRLPQMRGYAPLRDGTLADRTRDLLALGNGASEGVLSTAGELLTFMQVTAAGMLLPAELVLGMKMGTMQSGGSYGLGLSTYQLSCGTFYGQAGAVGGTQSIALVANDGQSGVVIAMNVIQDDSGALLMLAESMLCES